MAELGLTTLCFLMLVYMYKLYSFIKEGGEYNER